MDHNKILKWIIGSARSLPSTIQYNSKRLLKLIHLHNLSGRFLKKIALDPYSNFSEDFINSLIKQHKNVTNIVEKNLKSFQDIKKNLPNDVKIISIKGFSTYVIVNKREIMRSGDIDIISSNGEALIETLKVLNYKLTKQPFLYELGEYSKDEIEVDVHDHFPIYSYTSSLSSATLEPKKNANIWQQNYEMTKKCVTYNILSQYEYEGRTEDTKGVITAAPHIMAIIICSHAFMNYVNIWSISHREKVYIRLGEIADLFDLINHREFDREKFWLLVEELQAHDSINWVHYITKILFDKSPFGENNILGKKLTNPDFFPRNIWWNFWIDFPIERKLLLSDNWHSMKSLINNIGFNELSLDNIIQKKYITVPKLNGTLLNHLIIQNNVPFSSAIKINTNKKHLIIFIEINEAIEDFERIRIDFGNQASEWIYDRDKQKESLIGSKSETSFSLLENKGYILEFKYLLNTFYSSNSTKLDFLPLLIGIGKLSSSNKMINSMLIPILLKKGLID